jgi:transcriptional regulator with XRE-family HTH domain
MHSIYERIDLLIRMRRMTKKRFCEQLGISTGNLGDWKRGKSTPSSSKLIEIAAFFEVSLDWLMLGKESSISEVKEQTVSYGRSKEEAALSQEEEAFIREYIAFTQYRKKQEKDGGNSES